MDKRWRNLGVLLLVVIVLVLAILFVTRNPLVDFLNPLGVRVSAEDAPFIALSNLFEIKGFDPMKFRTNNLVVVNSLNELELVYSDTNLLSFKEDLLSLKGWYNYHLGDQKSVRFSSAVDVLSAEIDFDLNYFNFYTNNLDLKYKKNSASFSDDISFCRFVKENQIPQLEKLSELNDDLIDFEKKNTAHFDKYGVVIVDFNFDLAFENLYGLGNYYVDSVDYCDSKEAFE